ncbi:hypothetical protein CPAST_c34600 [Clostridium pasteurianum DSM 525 = ATCC 6013]|uniref:Uncharacterized protein n=1 Tax=Clostridium pasteurianum DSM 525 = ATCC 6013 TaxID=1262449 RepID=A0A0H3J683_CLOPA|nr:hypothetical protein [Clostridium pasteurianum]AJA49521.1 hypothetical protein CPAST_c34600 [Clostridium pasteurianum DSM 525 = ATCC 6013]AJA53509.1 hypothetical protein CLPA_c34600 [Clostridium pasteurianum DSM 525 = ATCC 6013]AOZ76682.1 hypothetical protein AQ983_16810 [Clostridium pasteurianum DSM 525 = ATCC 6013]AOZ80479.1 hypothetical protein AQ984_16805 [Clostridium pasteurianum]ELP58960.1 hypothetical protein F502_12566 [Clostridium pasteurianum DSM 525 = ATCC 6013]
MDKKALVEEIRKVLTSFIEDECKINMAMLVKDLDHDTYTFLLASYFLDLLTPYDGTKLVAEYFYKNLSKDAFSIISRINLVNTMDSSMSAIYGIMNVTNSIVSIEKCTFFNVYIEDAILLESHKD